MKIKGKKKKKKNISSTEKKDIIKKRHNKSKSEKKEKRKLWKILLTLFIIGCGIVVFSVFAFCVYIVVTTGEFDPTALANKDRTIIYDINGNEYATLGMENRESVTYEQLPEVLIDAIIATEDSRFFQHNGVDTARFLKASIQQLLGDRSAGGASTLTMQVVKNNLTDTTNAGIEGIIRKFRDVYLSVFFMEKNYIKEEILEFYVNDSTLGGGTYGVEEASKYYFGKTVSDLTLPEAAMIAGLFQAPNGYNPYYHPEEATARRSTVLKLMVKHGYITENEAEVANNISVESMLVGIEDEESKFQAYIDTVIDEIEDKTEQSPYLVPMKIYTNLNPSIQEGISNIMNNNSNYKWIDDYVQAGVTVLDVKSGAIVAIGGGRNRTGKRQWNYATQTRRQPGSTAKPIFAYGPGFEYNNFSTYELFNDEPWSYSDGTSIGNWDGGYEGLITLKRAVAVSRNIPAVKAIQQVGTKNVVKFVQSLGIDLNDVAYEAYALGGIDPGVTTVEMAGAYAAFANGGYYTEPYTVSKIVYRDSGEEVDMIPETNRAIKESTAYLLTNVLEYAANNGFSGGTSGYAGTVAVKTGTSNYPEEVLDEYRLPYSTVKDLWSVAYTPKYSISLWYGYDELSSEHYSTASYPKDQLMAAIMKYIPVCKDAFNVPSSVVASKVEFGTWPAQLPSEYTPNDLIRTEYFVKGTQPTEVSNRFSKFSDVADLKSVTNNSTITLTWSSKEPEVVTEDYLKEYFNQKVFGNGSGNFLKDRLNYNQNTLGGFGYGIYIKDSSGTLKQVGFTTNNTYTYKSSNNGTFTMVVKAQYKNFTANASDGASTKVVVTGIFSPEDDNIQVKLNGLESVIVDKTDKYQEAGISVLKNGIDITNQCSSISNECSINYSIVSSVGNVSATTEKEIETKINNMPSGVYTIKYVVKYNGERTTVERTVEVR